MQLPSSIVTLVVLSLCAWAPRAPSQEPGPSYLRPVNSASDPGSAARQAAGMTGGKVLDVQTRSYGNRQVYLVKVLMNDGRVKVIQINGGAATMPGFNGN